PDHKDAKTNRDLMRQILNHQQQQKQQSSQQNQHPQQQDLNDESFYHQTEQYSEHTQSYESLVSQPFSPAPLLANNPSPQKTTVTEDQPQAQKPVFDDKIPF
ncbi:hypothetical protein TI03_06550, partial [Achromatium sp. WMS1]